MKIGIKIKIKINKNLCVSVIQKRLKIGNSQFIPLIFKNCEGFVAGIVREKFFGNLILIENENKMEFFGGIII